MDQELKDLGALALRNAFYRDFSALVNLYMEAAEGLDVEQFEAQLAETASVFGRDPNAESDEPLSLWSTDAKGHDDDHRNMLEAMQRRNVAVIYLQGRTVFRESEGTLGFVEEAA
jgi:hypothetical protein